MEFPADAQIHFQCSAASSLGRDYMVVSKQYVIGTEPQRLFRAGLQYFCTRLDPRIGP
jgi:hypothetical protein